MKLITVLFVSALAITPAALLAQPATMDASPQTLIAAMPVASIVVKEAPARHKQQKGISAKSTVGSYLNESTIDSLPMEGRDVLNLVGSSR